MFLFQIHLIFNLFFPDVCMLECVQAVVSQEESSVGIHDGDIIVHT